MIFIDPLYSRTQLRSKLRYARPEQGALARTVRTSQEQDPNRLMELVNEINRMLSEKEERIQRQRQRHNEHQPPHAEEGAV